MEGEKRFVVFIGGAHGSGKSTVCSLLADGYDCHIAKQRHALIEVGAARGLMWPVVAAHHHTLITEAGLLVREQFFASRKRALLIDCHYAIRTGKALRPLPAQASGYIPDLDEFFVRTLSPLGSLLFVLLYIDSEVACQRLSEAHGGSAFEYEYTVEGNRNQAQAEREVFNRYVQLFRCPYRQHLVVEANVDAPSAGELIASRFLLS